MGEDFWLHEWCEVMYDVPGSPGGLARIGALFGNDGHETMFSNSPLIFGAFPSLHVAWATLGVLYPSTMYLTHHYLIDVVSGACLATAFFYLFMPDELRAPGGRGGRSKYDQYDLGPFGIGPDEFASDTAESADLSDEAELDQPIVYRSSNPNPNSSVNHTSGPGSGRGWTCAAGSEKKRGSREDAPAYCKHC